MRIRLNRPSAVSDLATELRAGDCYCSNVSGDTIAVAHAEAADEREARVELRFFLRTWLLGRPGLTAELLP
jgi:hypothetical protein